jgi:outer membrane autotransporter protein
MKKIVLAVLAFAAVGVQAADQGLYGGLNYNNLSLSDINEAASQSSPGVYGGYQLSNYGVEISHTKATGFSSTKATIGVTDLSVIPRLNVAKDVDLIGKVGVRHSTGHSYAGAGSSNTLVFGAGVEYNLFPQVTARALLDYSNKTGDVSAKATTATIGVAYKF